MLTTSIVIHFSKILMNPSSKEKNEAGIKKCLTL